MKALRVSAVLAVLAAGVLLTFYLAAVFYFLANRANPFGQVGVLTWFNYWQAYGIALPNLAGSLIAAFLVVAGLVLGLFIKSRNTPLHGESRFASMPEIRATGLLSNDGIIVGKYAGKHLQYGGSQHVALLAPTRSGKGVSCVVPNLLNYRHSAVVLDVKLENYSITSKYRAQFQDVYLFNPFSETTHRYNPLAYVSENPDQRVVDVLAIGHIIYPAANGSADSIWIDQARSLFVGISLMMIEIAPQFATMGNLLRHSSGKGKPLNEYLTLMMASHKLSVECRDALNRFITMPDTTAGGVLAQYNAPLTVFASPVVDNATSGNDFDIRQLRKRRMTVYVGIPVNKIDSAGIVLRLFFHQLISLNTDELLGDGGNTVPCLLMLDEFMSIGPLPILSKGSAYIAGYGLRMLIIAQSKSQLTASTYEGGYGRETAKAMLDNFACKIMFAPEDQADANELSDMLGYRTVTSTTRQIRGYGGSKSDTKRALMLPQELQSMGAANQIIRMGTGVRPIKCRKPRYYDDAYFIGLLKTVSPSLARLGKRLPNEQQLRDAWPELSAPVPTHDMGLARAKRDERKRPMTADDVAQPVQLDRVAVDLSALPKHDEPMSDSDVAAFADDFMFCMADEPPADVAPPAETSLPRAVVNTETGEITSTSHLIDLNKLKA